MGLILGRAAASDLNDSGPTSVNVCTHGISLHKSATELLVLSIRVTVLQVMSKAQLPLLTSVIMVTQAFISAPAGIWAKRSLKDRNKVLLLGYAAMIAADLTFAFMPTVYGEQA